MMRLIDADALIGGFGDWYVEGEEDGDIEFIGNIKQLMDYIATVDAVPVIRCKDCRHTEVITPEYIVCEIDMRKITDDGFCSWAERREEDETD